MPRSRAVVRYDQKAIPHWTLYVIRLKGDYYYIGITSKRDFMRRIHQHGKRTGAKVNQSKEVEEIVEIQDLGKITGLEANKIENEVMLQYRKKFGARRVRGGYEIYTYTHLIPTYTPGNPQSYILIIVSIIVAISLLLLILY